MWVLRIQTQILRLPQQASCWLRCLFRPRVCSTFDSENFYFWEFHACMHVLSLDPTHLTLSLLSFWMLSTFRWLAVSRLHHHRGMSGDQAAHVTRTAGSKGSFSSLLQSPGTTAGYTWLLVEQNVIIQHTIRYFKCYIKILTPHPKV